MWDVASEHLKNHPIEKWFDEDAEEVRVMVKATAEFPLEISVLFGEWLYNLRSALDALLYELAVEDTGQDPPTRKGDRQYPIAATREKFDGKWNAGLSEWTRKGIESTQPYHHTGGASGSAIWWLHELARIDRHRRHHAIRWRVVDLQVQANPTMFIGTGSRVCDERDAFLREGQQLELAAFRRRPNPRPHGDHAIDVEQRIEFDVPEWVRRAHPGFGLNLRVDDRMRWMETIVGKTIETFRDRLPDRQPWRN